MPEATTPRGAKPTPADCLVMFGITGDLARKKLFGALYKLEADGMLNCPVVGVASSTWTREELIGNAKEALEKTGVEVDPVVLLVLDSD